MGIITDRTKKIATLLAWIAIITLAASTGFANEGGEAAHHVDKGAQLKDLGWRVLNFVLLAAIVIYGMKKANLKGALAARQEKIEKDLQEAQAGKSAAEAKLAEYSQKIEQASNEIEAMYAAIIKEGELEKERIIKEANSTAAKIIEQAGQSADQEVIKARQTLRAEAARLAVELATGKLTNSIQKADHDRFFGEYLEKVVQVK